MAALKVNINGEPWTLRYVQPRSVKGDSGRCDYEKRRISLRNTEQGIERLDTLFHELFEARLPDLDHGVKDEMAALFAKATWWALME